MDYTAFFYIFQVTAFVSFVVSFLASKRKDVHGALELSRVMIASGIYSFFIAFEAASATMEEKVFWTKLAYIGGVTVPVFYFIFIMRYSGYGKAVSRKRAAYLFILPAITFILALTNEWHHLIWTGFSPVSPETNLMEYKHGIWFMLGYTAYDYLLLVIATFYLFHFIFRQKRTFRLQGLIVFIAGICPWIAGIVYLTDINPIKGFDISPASTLLSGLLVIYAIGKVRFLDLVPIAREVLFESLKDGIIALDAKNRVQDINKAACVYLGLADKRILGNEIVESELLNGPLLGAVLSPDVFEQFEYSHNLVKKTLRISKQDIAGERGSRLVIIQDISEQIAKQQEIQAGEERYRKMYSVFRLMADNMPDMLWAKDLNKKYIFTNKAICEDMLKAADTNEPIGKSYGFFMHREQSKYPQDLDWHTISATSERSDENVIQTGMPQRFDESGNVSGTFLYLDVRKAPIYDEKGNMIGIVGSARDVTLQKKIEADIYKRDILLHAISIATSNLIQEENLYEALQMSLETMGKAAGVNRIYIYNCIVVPDAQKPVMNLIHDWMDGTVVLRSGVQASSKPYLQLEISDWHQKLSQGIVCKGNVKDFDDTVRKRLELFDVKSILLTPIFIDKVFWGFIGFNDCVKERDWSISEEKLLSTVANTIGSAYVRKKNQEELVIAKEKAEESDRLKSAFLANLSHEIRTPMNSILGFISLLQEPDLSGEEKEEYFNIVKKGGERLLNTIHDIIDISKIESGQTMVSFTYLDINEMIFSLYSMYIKEAESKGLVLYQPELVPPDFSVIQTDKNKVCSVMSNLIKNALKYTNLGHIEFGCSRLPESVSFWVRDTGIGVPKDKQEKIFERFVQADGSNTRTYEGSGLGLSISKAYVEMLGGKIWVESEENKGSTFFFSIPAADAGKNPVKLASIVENKKFRPLKILVVEDDPANFAYINAILKKEKHKVFHAVTGLETIELCRQHRNMDIVLMDIKLPDIDGHEVTRRIRTFNQALPIVAVSAFATQNDREKALMAGCDDYLTKPMRKEDLLEVIQKYVPL